MSTAPRSASWVSRSTPWLLLAIAAVTIAVYLPIRQHEFVSIDDPLYVSENPVVARGLSWDGVAWAFTTGHAANWHPLTWLSHMLDVRLFGMAAGWHHVTSLVLHVANALLLFLLLARMTRRAGASAFVAALFAVHPLHVESVAWVAERKDVLSSFFWLLTLWSYLLHVGTPGRAGSPQARPGEPSRRAWYGLALVFYALGLMAKPMLVTLPFVLLLVDWWPLGRFGENRKIWRALAWEKVPFLALAVASSLITFLVQRRGGAVSNLAVVPFGERAANAVVAYGAYALKTVWPGGLSVFYPHPQSIPVVPLAISAAALIGVTWLAIRLARSRAYVLAGWLWYLITLAPVVGIVQMGRQAMADRYTYVPLIGLFVMAAWGAADLLARWPARRFVLPVTASSLVLLCAFTARAQVGYWANSASLWQHALDVDPGNYYALNSLGAMASDAGRVDEAIARFSDAIRFAPDYPEAYNNLGLAKVRKGLAAEAVPLYRKAIGLNPSLAEAHNNLGVALTTLGRAAEAVPEHEAAVRLKPTSAPFHNNLGVALYSSGRAADAIAPFTEALRLQTDLAPAHTGLALALTAVGRLGDALPHFTEAAGLQPGSDTAHQYLGIALAGAGRFGEAIAELNEALRINPANATARRALEMATARAQAPPGAGR
jgi:tetratricopeptide (TPR) repeat protein